MAWKKLINAFDERRDIIIPGDLKTTIEFAVKQWIEIGRASIEDHGFFSVALSGGTTPNAIYKALNHPSYADQIDWSRVFCFWSDERSVPPMHPENNFHQAMQAGLGSLPIPKEHLFRMHAEDDIEASALRYEEEILSIIPSQQFDLVMLGMGEDGHTASLFPRTHALHTKDRLVVANYVPQKHTWRMTLTFDCIHAARMICIYVTGSAKAQKVAEILTGAYNPDFLPAQRLGVPTHKALWILDQQAAEKLRLLT